MSIEDTLHALNSLDANSDIEYLWDRLMFNFTCDKSVENASFPRFALSNVSRPILELATEKQYRLPLSQISKDQEARLRNLAKRIQVTPGIFCLLFTAECASSRTCTDCLAELFYAQPELSLDTVLDELVSQAAALQADKKFRRQQPSRVALRNTILHFEPKIGQPQAKSKAKRHVKQFAKRLAKPSGHRVASIRRESPSFLRDHEEELPLSQQDLDSDHNNNNSDANDGKGGNREDHWNDVNRTNESIGDADFTDGSVLDSPSSDEDSSQDCSEEEMNEIQFGGSNSPVGDQSIAELSVEMGRGQQDSNADGYDGHSISSMPEQLLPSTVHIRKKRRSSSFIYSRPSKENQLDVPDFKRAKTDEPANTSAALLPASLCDGSPLRKETWGSAVNFGKPISPTSHPFPHYPSPPAPTESLRSARPSQTHSIKASRVDLNLLLHSHESFQPEMWCNDHGMWTLMSRHVTDDVGVIDSLWFQMQRTPATRHKLQPQVTKPVVLVLYNHSSSHWSLFRWCRQNSALEQYDSCRSLGLGSSAATAVESFLRWAYDNNGLEVDRREVECTQQDSDTDCGIFTLLFAESAAMSNAIPHYLDLKPSTYRDYFKRLLLTSKEATLRPTETSSVNEYMTSNTAERAAQLANLVHGRLYSQQLLARRMPTIQAKLRNQLGTIFQEETRLARIGILASAVRDFGQAHERALREANRAGKTAAAEAQRKDRWANMQQGLESFLSAYKQPTSDESANSELTEALELGFDALAKSAGAVLKLRAMTELDNPQEQAAASAAREEEVRNKYSESVVWMLLLRRAVGNFRQVADEDRQ